MIFSTVVLAALAASGWAQTQCDSVASQIPQCGVRLTAFRPPARPVLTLPDALHHRCCLPDWVRILQ
jgi:hypothetical protein